MPGKPDWAALIVGALCIALAAIFWTVGERSHQSPPKAPNVHTEGHAYGGLEAEYHAQSSADGSRYTVIIRPEAGADHGQGEPNANRREGDYLSRLVAHILDDKIVEFLLFVATAALVWATICLVKGAEKTAERELRAYLSLAPAGIIYNTTNEQLFVCVEQANMGQTPATHVRFSGVVRVLSRPLPAGFTFPEQFNPGRNVVHPGKKFMTQTLYDRYPTPGQLIAASAKNQWLYFFGRLTYDDVFGEHRETRVCWIHRPEMIAPHGDGERFDTDFDYTDEYNEIT
jgi:hypothetical protein